MFEFNLGFAIALTAMSCHETPESEMISLLRGWFGGEVHPIWGLWPGGRVLSNLCEGYYGGQAVEDWCRAHLPGIHEKAVKEMDLRRLYAPGMPCTKSINGDCYPYEVLEVKKRSLIVRGMGWIREDIEGPLRFTSDENAPWATVKWLNSKKKKGLYLNGFAFHVGKANHHLDPHR